MDVIKDVVVKVVYNLLFCKLNCPSFCRNIGQSSHFIAGKVLIATILNRNCRNISKLLSAGFVQQQLDHWPYLLAAV
jgi:hypothetical protein